MEQAKTKSLEAEEKEKELNNKILQCKKAIRTWISDIAEGDNALEKNIWQQINENKLVEHRDAVKVDVNYMFSILRGYGRNLLKRHFCMEILKKVGGLRDMGEEMLKIICNKMKLRTFEENKLVVEAAHPLEQMMIIIEGSLRMYQTTSDAAAAPPPQTVFEAGDIVGHELVSWAASIRNFKDPPTSNTYVKCLSKVTAFVLTSEDLRKLVSSKRIMFGTRAEPEVFQWMR
ncbi:unnamed protein product [Prunus armeniaca]|uniref:Cyclic nucleotide-binding domain-containing protein n=1 Tax=Prunus armeniaca TaxID=36596 RepID=A0A6J5UL80_PRUAR|nr:unnamed protein product [Prunus armeniaca]